VCARTSLLKLAAYDFVEPQQHKSSFELFKVAHVLVVELEELGVFHDGAYISHLAVRFVDESSLLFIILSGDKVSRNEIEI
jgi:hypothetical protein